MKDIISLLEVMVIREQPLAYVNPRTGWTHVHLALQGRHPIDGRVTYHRVILNNVNPAHASLMQLHQRIRVTRLGCAVKEVTAYGQTYAAVGG